MIVPVARGEARARQARRLVGVIALTSVILLLEVAGGWLSGSLALLSDAGHMLTDVLALVLSLIAVRLASLPPGGGKTYGYHRLEILTALLNGTLLILVSGALLVQAVRRFLQPQPIDGPMMIGVALVGLAANAVGLLILKGGERDLNIRGARMHLWGDALSSAGVVAASIAIAFTGWYWLDSLAAGAIALVVAAGAVRLVREAVDVLLEAAPAGLSLHDVGLAIGSLPGVAEVYDLHVWSISSGLSALSAHVRLNAASDGGDELLTRIKETMRERFGIVHTTIQLESPSYKEPGDVCA